MEHYCSFLLFFFPLKRKDRENKLQGCIFYTGRLLPPFCPPPGAPPAITSVHRHRPLPPSRALYKGSPACVLPPFLPLPHLSSPLHLLFSGHQQKMPASHHQPSCWFSLPVCCSSFSAAGDPPSSAAALPSTGRPISWMARKKKRKRLKPRRRASSTCERFRAAIL